VKAAAIAAALGDVRREGHAWRCRCPLHDGRSLVLRDGGVGRVLATCWGGCDRFNVLAELRRRGLLDGRSDYMPRIISTPCRYDDASRTARVMKIWRNTEPGAGTVVEAYLASRGIALNRWPGSLRFHPRCPRPKDDDGNFLTPLPAMLALVEHVEHGPVAVHATYLEPEGAGKAEIGKAKAIFGPVAGSGVRFGTALHGQWLAVAEGIETALSVATACAMPAWAALSAGGIKNLTLPAEATQILVCADHDANGVGERAAHDAAERWLAEGRRVRVAMPPQAGIDFNDVLIACDAAKTDEVRYVA
jgi:putative DNA primase/helicase